MRTSRFLMALASIAPALPLALLGAFAYWSHDRQFQQATERAERRALVLSEEVRRMLDLEAQFIATVDSVGGMGIDLTRMLRRHAAASSMVVAASVIDGHGTIVASSNAAAVGLGVAERAFFQETLGTDAVVIGPTIMARAAAAEMFTISRRRTPPGQGAVMIGVSAGQLSSTFASALQKDAFDGVIALVRKDGLILARHPHLSEVTRLSPLSGLLRHVKDADGATYRMRSELDGKERVFSYHRIGASALYLTYGIDVDDVLAPWWRQLAIYGLIAAACSAVLLALAGMTWRQARADANMARELRRKVAERTAEAERRAEDAEKATREKDAALRLAELASAQKSHFLAAASHDLRQPAQALRLFIETMKVQAEAPKLRRIAELASESLQGMETLLQTLLDMSVLEAGTANVAVGDVALRPLFGRIAAEFGPLAAYKGLHLSVVDTAAAVRSDPVHLDRILRNLVSNAIKYTRSGKVLLGVRRAGPDLRIEVRDTGIGIPAEAIERIFDDFYQLHNEARNREIGFGLGLGIVRRTAELLGHRMEVRSRPGNGSSFAVVARASAAPQAEAPAPVPSRTA